LGVGRNSLAESVQLNDGNRRHRWPAFESDLAFV